MVSMAATCATMSWMRGESAGLLLEIGGDALPEVERLADVEHLAGGVQHAVDAGQVRQPRDDFGRREQAAAA